MHRLLVHRRRRNPSVLQDPAYLLLLHPLRRKRAAGVAAIQYVIEFDRLIHNSKAFQADKTKGQKKLSRPRYFRTYAKPFCSPRPHSSG